MPLIPSLQRTLPKRSVDRSRSALLDLGDDAGCTACRCHDVCEALDRTRPFAVRWRRLSVVKVLETNLLEDEIEELNVYQAEDNSAAVKLSFHGFEVKTIKLVLGKQRYAVSLSHIRRAVLI